MKNIFKRKKIVTNVHILLAIHEKEIEVVDVSEDLIKTMDLKESLQEVNTLFDPIKYYILSKELKI